jgi:pyrimidine operon attenuation protein/uracil phosphoribosyltransferase
MHHQAGGLIYHDKMLILVDDLKINWLRSALDLVLDYGRELDLIA